MARTPLTVILFLAMLGMVPGTSLADKEQPAGKKEGLLPKVDKPIADTYAPLDGADWNHRMSPELQTLREYQRQEREQEEQASEEELRSRLESRIQAPDPGAPGAGQKPAIQETEEGLRISDPD